MKRFFSLLGVVALIAFILPVTNCSGGGGDVFKAEIVSYTLYRIKTVHIYNESSEILYFKIIDDDGYSSSFTINAGENKAVINRVIAGVSDFSEDDAMYICVYDESFHVIYTYPSSVSPFYFYGYDTMAYKDFSTTEKSNQ